MSAFGEILLARNTTSVLITNDKDDEHLRQCWRIQYCGNCIASEHNCGWCPYSSTCAPLPHLTFPLSLLPNLLLPLTNPDICPLPWQERYELRTAPFGCNCSTTSFLVSAATILATLAGLFILICLIKACKWIGKVWKGSGGGWTVHVRGDGGRVGHVWVRRRVEGWIGRGWRRFWKGYREDEEEVRPLLA